MLLLNPIDLAEKSLDVGEIAPAVLGTYTFNGGKRSDKDIDGTDNPVFSWEMPTNLGVTTIIQNSIHKG